MMRKRIGAFELRVYRRIINKFLDNYQSISAEVSSAQEGMPASWHNEYEHGILWQYHQVQHTPTCITRWANRRQAQPGQTNTDVVRKHYRVVMIGLCSLSLSISLSISLFLSLSRSL